MFFPSENYTSYQGMSSVLHSFLQRRIVRYGKHFQANILHKIKHPAYIKRKGTYVACILKFAVLGKVFYHSSSVKDFERVSLIAKIDLEKC